MALQVYELQQDCMGYKAGDRVELDPETDTFVATLIEGGYLAEAEAVSDEEEEPQEEEAPVDAVAAALNALNQKLTSLEAAKAEAEKKSQKPERKVPSFKLPAQPKEVFKGSIGDCIRTLYKAKICGDYKAQNKFDAHYKAVTQMSTSANDGGNYINQTYSDSVWKLPVDDVNLMDFCETQTGVTGATHNVRIVTGTSLAGGSLYGGVTVAKVSEGATYSGSKPTTSTEAITLDKYVGTTTFTRELLEDQSYNLEKDVEEMFKTEFLLKINDDLLNSASDPEGILNATALVTVSKESNQASRSLLYANLRKMWSRLLPAAKKNAVIFYNPELEAEFHGMTFTSSGDTPVHGITFDPADPFPIRFFSRPCVPLWACSALGLAGDILMVDLSWYACRATNFSIDISNAPHWGTDELDVRYVTRLGGLNKLRNKVTGRTGSQTYSNLVTRETVGSS